MEGAANSRYIAFDAVEIDLVSRRVCVAGEEVALEPKAFDVLVLFAQAPGKAFTRDEILDTVWGHRHVTPGVLNRVIVLIRHALGESAQNLHTLYGVGYRFDGDVRFAAHHAAPRSPTPEAGGGAPLPSDDGATAPAAGTPAVAPVPIDPEAAASPAPPATMQPVVRRRRLLLAATLAALVIALITRFAGHHDAAGAPASPTLVVLPLDAIGGDRNEAAFAEGLSEELTTRLARIHGLHLISGNSAERAQREGFDMAQLADRLHVTHAIEGSLREAGDQLRIDLRLIEVPSGKTIWAQGYDRKFADILTVQQEVAQAVASTLTLRMGLARGQVQAADPQVLREYLTLRHTFLNEMHSTAYEKAEADLEALAARAPDFTPAHGLLALNLASGFEGLGKEGTALHEAKHTLELDPRNFYARAAMGMLAEKNHDWAAAKQEYEAALRFDPSDAIMHNIMGMWLGRLGYGDLALAQFQTSYASDPLGYWVTYNLGIQLDAVGRHDEARHYLDKLTRLEDTPSPRTASARWRNAVWRGDLVAARRIAMQMPEGTGMRPAYVAVTAALADRSRWPSAEAAMTAYESGLGRPTRLRLFGPAPSAAALLESMETFAPQPDGKIVWTPELVALRRTPAFQAFVKHMEFIGYWNINGWPLQCQPEGGSARCR